MDREISDVKPATDPLQVVLLADTTSGAQDILQDLRKSLTGFVHQVLTVSPDASVMLMEFGQAAIPVVPFTSSFADFDKGINRLTAKPGVGSVLLEALGAANGDLAKRPTTRRAIVTLNLEPSDEQSREEPEEDRRGVPQVGRPALVLVGAAWRPEELEARCRDQRFRQGNRRAARLHRRHLRSVRHPPALCGHAGEPVRVVYKRPESNKPPQVIQVGTLLQNVKTHASGFAPQ